MTQHDTLALIERHYAAFNRGDWQAMLDCRGTGVRHDLDHDSLADWLVQVGSA